MLFILYNLFGGQHLGNFYQYNNIVVVPHNSAFVISIFAPGAMCENDSSLCESLRRQGALQMFMCGHGYWRLQ